MNCDQFLPLSALKKVERCDAGTWVRTVATATEENCFGPCEPGTSVTLEGIVWHETAGGILVVNVTWRSKSYVGTLLDCTKYDWAPPRLCESPHIENDGLKTPAKGGRGGKRNNGGHNHKVSTVGSNGTVTNGSLNESWATTGRASTKTASTSSKEDGMIASDLKLDTALQNSGERLTLNRNILEPFSPILFECPLEDCEKKFALLTGLKYHQNSSHRVVTPSEGNVSENVSCSRPSSGSGKVISKSDTSVPLTVCTEAATETGPVMTGHSLEELELFTAQPANGPGVVEVTATPRATLADLAQVAVGLEKQCVSTSGTDSRKLSAAEAESLDSLFRVVASSQQRIPPGSVASPDQNSFLLVSQLHNAPPSSQDLPKLEPSTTAQQSVNLDVASSPAYSDISDDEGAPVLEQVIDKNIVPVSSCINAVDTAADPASPSLQSDSSSALLTASPHRQRSPSVPMPKTSGGYSMLGQTTAFTPDKHRNEQKTFLDKQPKASAFVMNTSTTANSAGSGSSAYSKGRLDAQVLSQRSGKSSSSCSSSASSSDGKLEVKSPVPVPVPAPSESQSSSMHPVVAAAALVNGIPAPFTFSPFSPSAYAGHPNAAVAAAAAAAVYSTNGGGGGGGNGSGVALDPSSLILNVSGHPMYATSGMLASTFPVGGISAHSASAFMPSSALITSCAPATLQMNTPHKIHELNDHRGSTQTVTDQSSPLVSSPAARLTNGGRLGAAHVLNDRELTSIAAANTPASVTSRGVDRVQYAGGAASGGAGVDQNVAAAAAKTRSPPVQRHFHTHHHTHSYPLLAPTLEPYAAIMASQQAAAAAANVVGTFPQFNPK